MEHSPVQKPADAETTKACKRPYTKNEKKSLLHTVTGKTKVCDEGQQGYKPSNPPLSVCKLVK